MCFFTRPQLQQFLADEKLVSKFPFNEREMEVMRLYARYLTFKQIAEKQGEVSRQKPQEVYCNAMKKIAGEFMKMLGEL
jgi:hypothetical protein